MFDQALSVNHNTLGGTLGTKVYDLVSFPTGTQSLRRISATSATTPQSLSIAHSDVKVGGEAYKQHMVRMDHTYTDLVKGPQTASCWLVIRHPNNGSTIITSAVLKDVVGGVLAVEQTAGAFDKLLNSEQ